MLKAVWDKAVKTYNAIQQKSDHMLLEEIAKVEERAKEGYELIPVGSPIMFGPGYTLERVELKPEEAEKLIKRCGEQREEVVKRMQQRRENFGLKL